MSKCRPMRVVAIEPVGMTNASASNVRNKNANTNAMTIDSTVSRTVRSQLPVLMGLGLDLVGGAASLFGFIFNLGHLVAF